MGVKHVHEPKYERTVDRTFPLSGCYVAIGLLVSGLEVGSNILEIFSVWKNENDHCPEFCHRV